MQDGKNTKDEKNTKDNLKVFPGRKTELPLNQSKLEALRKLKEEELKGFQLNLDTNSKNPSPATVAQAIIDCDGLVMKAASSLKISYRKIIALVKKHPRLKEIVQDSTEMFLDYTENKLKELVMQGDKGAILFTLKCRGKHRGWVEDGKTPTDLEEKQVNFAYDLVLPEGAKIVGSDGNVIYQKNEKKVAEAK